MTLDDFVLVLRDSLGLPVTAEVVREDFDQVPGWDSVHLLALVTVLERETGRQVSLPDALEARTLKDIYDLATVG
ncbi:acyl carrier protein [Embleya sp. NPDC055664]|uniref:acyl carrier protein n=1 Tax=Embleya sp. MST-111070 TaxID=3398231 RepID=UPI003F741080